MHENYQKYGLLEGKVTHIADDAIEDEKLEPIYEITVAPTKDYLIIDFFIYPMIKYLDEGLSVRCCINVKH